MGYPANAKFRKIAPQDVPVLHFDIKCEKCNSILKEGVGIIGYHIIAKCPTCEEVTVATNIERRPKA